MKNYLVTLLIVSGILFTGTLQASNSLSDIELAGISGGGIDPQLEGQSLPQEQQQPANNNAGYTPPRQLLNNDGMELAPEIFTIMQSTANVRRERKLLLNGVTQQDVQALNLENLISSDAVSINNIFNGGNLTLDDVTTGIEVNQLNSLHQLHRTQGYLSSSVAGHRFETIIERRSGSENYDYLAYSNIYQQRRSSLLRTDFSLSAAHVGDRYASLDEINANAMPITLIAPPDFGTHLRFGPIGEVGDTKLFGKYGAKLEYTGVTVTGAGINLTNIGAGGTNNNDLHLGTAVILPKLDFGQIDMTGCIVLCADATLILGSLGGNTVPFTVKVPGYGPQVDELHLGSGFALSGTAPDLLFEPGGLTINGDASLKITPYARLTLDFSKLELLGLNIGTIVKGLKLKLFTDEQGNYTDKVIRRWEHVAFDKQIDFELLNEKFGKDRFETMPGTNEGFSDEVLTEDNDTIEIYKTNDIANSSLSEFYEHSVITGGQMTGAEAELLALSEGTLSVDKNSMISLTESAQQNMRVFNGVNAVSSVAANALNISRLPVLTGGSSVAAQISMQQHNQFIQQR